MLRDVDSISMVVIRFIIMTVIITTTPTTTIVIIITIIIIIIIIVHSHFSWTFLSKGERCMRLSLCKAPTLRRNNTKDSHNTGKLHALLFLNSVWVL